LPKENIMKKCLADFDYNEITNLLKDMGQPKYRGEQLFKDVCSYKSFDEMTTLPKTLREKLKEEYFDKALYIEKYFESKDGTIKFLFKLNDGNLIEGVLMKYKYGNTLCLSTQVGCRMGCEFCASTKDGLVRNMTVGEIATEVYAVNSFLGGNIQKREVTNLVLMGSGEPFDNYSNLIGFLKVIMSDIGLNISARNISLSTCGLVDNIYKFCDEGIPLNLTISLHNPFDEDRKKVMPIAKKYTIKEILDACEAYFKKTKRRYIFEYVLINGENDTEAHVKELTRLLKGKPCHINLIRLNEIKETSLKSVTDKNAYLFMDKLVKNGLSATVRRQIGVDIEGACGQLRRRYIEEEKNEGTSN